MQFLRIKKFFKHYGVLIMGIVIFLIFSWQISHLLYVQSQNNSLDKQEAMVFDNTNKLDTLQITHFIKSGKRIDLNSEQEIRDFLRQTQYRLKNKHSHLEYDSIFKKLQNQDTISFDQEELPIAVNSGSVIDSFSQANEYRNFQEFTQLAQLKSFEQVDFSDRDRSDKRHQPFDNWLGRVDAENNLVIFHKVGDPQKKKVYHPHSGYVQKFLVHNNYLYIFGSADEFYLQQEYNDYLRKLPFSFIEIYDLKKETENSLVTNYLFEGTFDEVFVINDMLYFYTTNIGFQHYDTEPILPRFLKNGQNANFSNISAHSFDVLYTQLNIRSIYKLDITDVFNSQIGVDHFFVNGNEIVQYRPDDFQIVINYEIDEALMRLFRKLTVLFDILPHTIKHQAEVIFETPQYILSNQEKVFKVNQILESYLYSLNNFERDKLNELVENDFKEYFLQEYKNFEKSTVHHVKINNTDILQNEYFIYTLDGIVLYDESIGTLFYNKYIYVPIIFTRVGLLEHIFNSEKNDNISERENYLNSYIISENQELFAQDPITDSLGMRFVFTDRVLYQFSFDQGQDYYIDFYSYDFDHQKLQKDTSKKLSELYDVFVLHSGSYDFFLKKDVVIDNNGVISQNGTFLKRINRYDDGVNSDIEINLLNDTEGYYVNNFVNGLYFDKNRFAIPVYTRLQNGHYKNRLMVIRFETESFKKVFKVEKEVDLGTTPLPDHYVISSLASQDIEIWSNYYLYNIDNNFNIYKQVDLR